MQAADDEGEWLGPIDGHDLAAAHRKVVEQEVRWRAGTICRLAAVAHQSSIGVEHEVALAPVLYVLAPLHQPPLLYDLSLFRKRMTRCNAGRAEVESCVY